MGAESNVEQLFRRLDQLKAEKGTLGIQATHFMGAESNAEQGGEGHTGNTGGTSSRSPSR